MATVYPISVTPSVTPHKTRPALLERLWDLLRQRAQSLDGQSFQVGHRALAEALGCSPSAVCTEVHRLLDLQAISRAKIVNSYLFSVHGADRSICAVLADASAVESERSNDLQLAHDQVLDEPLTDRSISESLEHQDALNLCTGNDQSPNHAAWNHDSYSNNNNNKQHVKSFFPPYGAPGWSAESDPERHPEIMAGSWIKIKRHHPTMTKTDFLLNLARGRLRREVPDEDVFRWVIGILQRGGTMLSRDEIGDRQSAQATYLQSHFPFPLPHQGAAHHETETVSNEITADTTTTSAGASAAAKPSRGSTQRGSANSGKQRRSGAVQRPSNHIPVNHGIDEDLLALLDLP